MKILFIQLPLSDHNLDYISGNIPYAPETIAGYILLRYDNIDVLTLPFHITNFGSDSIIIKSIQSFGCTVIAFTCYAWNIERSLKIASFLKTANPSLVIIFGGPEIASGSAALNYMNGAVDFFVSGEGEWFFDKYLSKGDINFQRTGINSSTAIIQPQNELIPAADIFDPVAGKRLTPMIDGSIFLELTRGCPYRCSYCYYSKNCLTVRELPFSRLENAFDSGCAIGLNEIYILSPTFNASKDFISRLERLSSINYGVSLHTEMRAEKIDRDTARLIRDAGFRSLEIGLQTMNRAALKIAGRGSDPYAEAEGILRLKEAGIDLKVGMIPGLSGDDPDSFMRGIEYLDSIGLSDTIELYSLMILPGTRVRETADARGYSYQNNPPYYFLEGGDFTYNDIVDISAKVEDISGFSRVTTRMPDLSFSSTGVLCKGVIFNGDDISKWNSCAAEDLIETSPFTIQIKINRKNSIVEGIPLLLDKILNNGLFNIVIHSDQFLDENFLTGYMLQHQGDNYYYRSNIFGEWREGLNARFYQLFSDPAAHGKAYNEYHFIEPVFSLSAEKGVLPRITTGVSMIFVRNGAWLKFRDFLIQNYTESPELVSFENEDELKAFYDLVGFKYTGYPFVFRTCIL